MVNIPAELRRCRRDSAPLTATVILMVVALVVAVAGLFLDPRTITGIPAWIKPAKFAISTGIFAGTIAWLFRYITIWPRLRRITGWILAAALTVEVAIIDFQAARGTTSHFNASTPFDSALFNIMGAAILLLWLASVAVLVALFRQRFENAGWGWLLRLGMLTTVLGSAGGGLMLGVTAEQAATLRAGHTLRAFGGHTVGAADGGPGLPVLGWSTQHGDLRIAHFLGLHGVQIIPLIGWFAMRRRRVQDRRTQTRLAFALAASYIALMAILTWQALRGQSVVHPDVKTLAAIAIWLLVSGVATVLALATWAPERLAAGAR